MRRIATLLAGLALVGFVAPALAAEDCSCKEIKTNGSGWCKECKSGAMYGVKLKSEKLYSALQGNTVKDASKIKCAGCKAAAKDGGTCEGCHVAFHDGKAYHSPVSQILAQGHLVKIDDMKCAGCKSAAKAGGGYCKECKAGIVGKLAFHGEKLFKQAKKSLKTLKTAAKASEKCETCAVAMVSDGKCEACKAQFKNGEKIAKTG